MYDKYVLSGQYLEVYEFSERPYSEKARTYLGGFRETPHDCADSCTHYRSLGSLRRARRNFLRIVRSNLVGQIFPSFLTLTFATVADFNYASPRFNRFSKKLTYHFGKDVKYIAVPEFQKRGAVHYHVLIWGIPYDVVSSERYTRFIANLWGHGYVDVIQTDGSQKIAGYMAKYMLKAMQDTRLFGRRVFNASRNCLRPAVISSDIGKKLSTTNHIEVLTERVYETEWRGRVNYRLIKLIESNEGSYH